MGKPLVRRSSGLLAELARESARRHRRVAGQILHPSTAGRPEGSRRSCNGRNRIWAKGSAHPALNRKTGTPASSRLAGIPGLF